MYVCDIPFFQIRVPILYCDHLCQHGVQPLRVYEIEVTQSTTDNHMHGRFGCFIPSIFSSHGHNSSPSRTFQMRMQREYFCDRSRALMSGIILIMSNGIPRHEGNLGFSFGAVFPVTKVNSHCCQGEVVVAHFDFFETFDMSLLCQLQEEIMFW